jgi:hypothetical protein
MFVAATSTSRTATVDEWAATPPGTEKGPAISSNSKDVAPPNPELQVGLFSEVLNMSGPATETVQDSGGPATDNAETLPSLRHDAQSSTADTNSSNDSPAPIRNEADLTGSSETEVPTEGAIFADERLEDDPEGADQPSPALDISHDDLRDPELAAPLDNNAPQQLAPSVPPDHAPQVAAFAKEAPDIPSPSVDNARSGALDRQPTPASAPPRPRIAGLDAEQLVMRGYLFFDQGDPASARLFFERAAGDGHAAAMMAVGETFDPVELRRRGIISIRGDADRALSWYRRGAEAGDMAAREHFARLSAWISRPENPH